MDWSSVLILFGLLMVEVAFLACRLGKFTHDCDEDMERMFWEEMKRQGKC